MPLQLHLYQQPDDKPVWHEVLHPDADTLIVSDLTTKFAVQQGLLQKHEVLPENTVLRATEFWRKAVTWLRPQFRFISPHLCQSLITHWLSAQTSAWPLTPGTPQLAMAYVEQLLPLLCHKEGPELLKQWLNENPSAMVRWGQWFYLANDVWQWLLASGWINSRWASALLVQESFARLAWSRRLVFDLGVGLNGVEGELIKNLAEHYQVEVWCPTPEWGGDRYQSCTWGYEFLQPVPGPGHGRGFPNTDASEAAPTSKERRARKQGLAPLFTQPTPQFGFKRFATMTSEVKETVSRIRTWLDADVAPTNIAVVAADIEIYWPVLSRYLEMEGVPAKKPQVHTLQTLPDVMAWLANLRLALGRVSTPDLELNLFNEGQSKPTLTFEKFWRLFAVIFDLQDLDRAENIKRRFGQKKLSPETEMTRDEWLAWALSFWSDESEWESAESLLHALVQDAPANVKMQAKEWLGYFETLASRIEFTARAAAAEGVHIVNLQSAPFLDVTHVVLLNASEEALHTTSKTAMTLQDARKLRHDLGFNVSAPEQLQNEFLCRWLLAKNLEQAMICFSGSDFQGRVQAPAVLWLQGALINDHDPEATVVPSATRWDEVQTSALAEIAGLRGWDESRSLQVEQALREDLGRSPLAPFYPSAPPLLSVTLLERYLECPFVFAAEKLLSLTDWPSVDLDVDRLTKGQLMHALFEALSQEPMRFDWSESELSQVLERLREQERMVFAGQAAWEAVKAKHMRLAKRFLESEKNWRQNFPKTTTVGRETAIHADWDHKKRTFVSQGQGDFTFFGKMDRVDTDGEGHYVLLDYKSSSAQASTYVGWIEKNQLQLLLYAQAIEQGFSELSPGEVVGAFYYVASNLERHKGFGLKEKGEHLFHLSPRGKSALDEETKQELLKQANAKVGEVVEAIQQGAFAPAPREVAVCLKCSWRGLCRAPHLH